MVSVATSSARDRKQAQRELLVAQAESELGTAEDHPGDHAITSTRPEEIVLRLKAQQPGWTAEAVMSAFIRAACAAHRKTNCLTEILFEEALEEARRKDKTFLTTGEAQGEFWGLPCSFKDNFNIVGVDSSIGCSPHCSKPTQSEGDEAGLVKLVRAAGGIPFCKTNVPQTMLAFECSNPIFGRTTNPYSSSRGPGGSSGGEAALVTLGATPFGWGTDIGGSLRIPAAYSGCCGLKGVRGRMPTFGVRTTTAGFEGIKSVSGPLARTVADLTFQSKVVIDRVADAQYNLGGEYLLPIPWRPVELRKKLKIGYYVDDGCIPSSPACARAVKEVVQRLEAAGHEVVLFQPPNPVEIFKCFVGLTSADGYKLLLSNIGSDPMDPSLKLVTFGPSLPRIVHAAISWFVKTVLKDTMFASVFSTSRSKTVGEYWQGVKQRDQLTNDFHQAWEGAGLDAVICPAQAVPALEHGATEFLSPLVAATSMYNVVDSTVGVLPVTRVDRELDAATQDHASGSGGSWLLKRRVYGTSTPAYDADKMHGLPVGIQVVGRPYEEEKVLKIMGMIEGMAGYA